MSAKVDNTLFDPESILAPVTSGHGDEIDRVKAAEQLLHEAEEATASEHRMGLWQGLKTYPKASAWSIAISFAVVMEGFDVVLLGSFSAYPVFRERFGILADDGTYQIPARWQAGLSNGANVGQIFGLILNGFVAERYGYRKTMLVALFFLTGFIFIFFFAQSLEMLLVAEILCGVPWGIFQTLTTSYASEVAPVALRGYLTTWVNACWGIGQLISLSVLRGLLNRTDQWGWRIPYALQWIWPVPLALVAFFAPESPWWLVRHDKIAEARRSLERLTTKRQGDDFDVDNTIAMMRHTNHLEMEITKGASYLDCFRGVDLRRTEIVCGSWAVQQLCGSAFMSYSTYFFQQAGLSDTKSFDLSMGQYAINTGGTFIAWFLMSQNVGRRSLYLYGCVGMGLALLLIGGIGEIHHNQSASWAAAILLLVWSIAYQFSVGTVCYSLVAELSSRRLLIKSINLGRGLYCVIGIVNGTITPYMLNPLVCLMSSLYSSFRERDLTPNLATAWGWGSRAAFFWAGLDVIVIVWVFFRLPEPAGLTFGEIDRLFELMIPARKFKKAGVDTFGRDKERLERVKEQVVLGHIAEKSESKAQVAHIDSI